MLRLALVLIVVTIINAVLLAARGGGCGVGAARDEVDFFVVGAHARQAAAAARRVGFPHRRH
jgi:hypothetical protein